MNSTSTIGDTMSTTQATTSADSSTTARVAEAAHAAVDAAAANLAHAEKALREARANAGLTASEAVHHAQVATEDTLASARRYIEENPLRAVGIALAAGYLASVILRK